MLTITQYIKEEGSCKRTRFALMLTFLPDKFYYYLSVKDYTGLNLQWCPLFKWMLTTFHTFGTICLRKHIFWMSIASDWSLKDRIPIFVLHVKIILYEIHFSATASTSWLPAPPCFLYTAGCSWASFQNLSMLVRMMRRMVMVKMMLTTKRMEWKDGNEAIFMYL